MAAIEDFILRFKVVGESSVRSVRGAVSGLKDDVADFAQVGGPLQNTLNGIIGRLGGVGLAAGAMATAMGLAGARALSLAGELMDVSGATGIAAGKIADFKTSVIEAGGRAEDATTILTRLNQSVQEAAAGNELLQKAFQNLGVYVTDANGKLRPTGDILTDITEKFQSGAISPEQYAAAVDILGKSVSRLELEKLRAVENVKLTEAAKELDRFNDEIDKLVDNINKSLISSFGGLAKAINEGGIAGGLAKITEEVGTLVGRLLNVPTDVIASAWNALVPDALKIKNAVGLGDGLIALSDKARAAREKALEDEKKFNAAREAEAKRAKEAQDKLKPPATPATPEGNAKGGYGKTPEAQLNAIKAYNKRLKDNEIEITREAELQKNQIRLEEAMKGASKLQSYQAKANADIKQIEINAAQDIKKAKSDVFSQERLTEEQKAAEFAQRKAQIEIEAATNVSQVRMRLYDEERREQERIAGIIQQARARVQEEEAINEVIRARNKFSNDNYAATDRERTQAEALFDLEQERQENLRRIRQIKDLPPDEITKKEKELNAVFEERLGLLKKQQDIDNQRQKDFSKGWEKAYRQYREDSENAFNAAGRLFDKVTSGMEDAIVDFAKTGKFEFKSFMNSILEELLRSQVRQLISQIFNIGGSRGGSGSILGSIGNILGFANGGIIPTNAPVLVGERGPEIISGAAGRNVTPNEQLGLGTTSVIYNINAVDAFSFKQLVASDPSFLYAVTEQGRKLIPGSRR